MSNRREGSDSDTEANGEGPSALQVRFSTVTSRKHREDQDEGDESLSEHNLSGTDVWNSLNNEELFGVEEGWGEVLEDEDS